MKSLATITEDDIDTIKVALNDSISDINQELKGEIKQRKKVELLDYKDKYLKVYNKLRQNPSIYSLSETELDVTAGGLNDAIQLLEEMLASENLDNLEQEKIITTRDECSHLVQILAGWLLKIFS